MAPRAKGSVCIISRCNTHTYDNYVSLSSTCDSEKAISLSNSLCFDSTRFTLTGLTNRLEQLAWGISARDKAGDVAKLALNNDTLIFSHPSSLCVIPFFSSIVLKKYDKLSHKETRTHGQTPRTFIRCICISFRYIEQRRLRWNNAECICAAPCQRITPHPEQTMLLFSFRR